MIHNITYMKRYLTQQTKVCNRKKNSSELINYKYNTDIIISQQVDENQFGETDIGCVDSYEK